MHLLVMQLSGQIPGALRADLRSLIELVSENVKFVVLLVQWHWACVCVYITCGAMPFDAAVMFYFGLLLSCRHNCRQKGTGLPPDPQGLSAMHCTHFSFYNSHSISGEPQTLDDINGCGPVCVSAENAEKISKCD